MRIMEEAAAGAEGSAEQSQDRADPCQEAGGDPWGGSAEYWNRRQRLRTPPSSAPRRSPPVMPGQTAGASDTSSLSGASSRRTAANKALYWSDDGFWRQCWILGAGAVGYLRVMFISKQTTAVPVAGALLRPAITSAERKRQSVQKSQESSETPMRRCMCVQE